MPDSSAAWAVCPDVVTRRLGDTLVAVSLATNRIFELNRTGSRIWELVAAGGSHEQVVSSLIEEFDVTREVASRQVGDLRSQLLAEGLVEAANAG